MTKSPEISLNIRLMVIYLFYNNANAPAGTGDLRHYRQIKVTDANSKLRFLG
jgi:hypothetical protein